MRCRHWTGMVAALTCIFCLGGLARAVAPPELAGTSWTLTGKGRISMQRVGTMPLLTEIRLSFEDQEKVHINYGAEEPPHVLAGDYSCDARGRLKINLDPATIQDFLCANLADFIYPYTPEMLDLTFTAPPSMTTTGRVTSGRRGTSMTLAISLRAVVGYEISGQTRVGRMTYRLGARGAMD